MPTEDWSTPPVPGPDVLWVVHLEEDGGARRQQHAVPLGVDQRRDARTPAADEVEVERSRALDALDRGAGRPQIGELVVHGFQEGGVDLDRLDPAVLFEVALDLEPLVVILHLVGHLERLHGEDHVGLADLPLRREGRRLGRLRQVAGRRARLDPTCEEVELLVAEARILQELTVLGVGEPGGHGEIVRRLSDGLRPGTRLGVGQQRHRRGLAGSVAADAPLVEDRRHVLGPGHGIRVGGRVAGRSGRGREHGAGDRENERGGRREAKAPGGRHGRPLPGS
ncbi:MAG TPA: hypothetical protein VMT85_21305 [Thermoanaerobaculia bacterium]|nr:hypothetical protein [Thermoanaerobaculia bacterium]